MVLMTYLKGAGGLILVGILVILAAIFYFVFHSLLVIALAILVIAAILLLPYYFGRESEPEKPGNYKLEKVKE